MAFIKASACVLLCAGLAGCATGYHSADNPILGFTGGYWEQPGPGELLKVGFAANGFSNRDTVTAYLMYHCAELAQKRNKPYFRIYYSLPDAIRDKPIDEALIGRVGGKLGDWVFVMFDNSEQPGDLGTQAMLDKYGPTVHSQENQS
jgi:hypothetical protein